jgi:hypothetical protein
MGQKLTTSAFRGEVPKLGRFYLPSGQAAYAVNAILKSGELRPLHGPSLAHTFACNPITDPIRYAFRVPVSKDAVYPEVWLPFQDDKVSFIKGPLIKDKYERYYWTSDNGETAQASQRAMQFATRAFMAETPADPCDTTGLRIGVPRPLKEPSVTSGHRVHMSYKPHWTGDTSPPTDPDLPIPGDWWQSSGGGKYRVKVEAGTTEWFALIGDLNATVTKHADLSTLTSLAKNDYALVTDDPNAEKNGFYVASKAGSNLTPGEWKFTGNFVADRQYSNTQLVPNDKDPYWDKVQREFQLWDGDDIGTFIRDIKDTNTTAVPEFLDTIFASVPSVEVGFEDIWGWFWVKDDPATTGATDNEDIISAVTPESHTEMVTRAYVYTYVNALGEEGPPSDPRQYDALDGEAWCIHNFDLETPDNDADYPSTAGPANRAPIVAIRVYRTITGTSGSADYFYVGEMPIKANLPLSSTLTTPTAANYLYPKYYNVADETLISGTTNVRHNDWCLVDTDSARVDGSNKFQVYRWYKATVRDHEGVINEDNVTSLEYSTSLTPGQFGFEWVEMPGGYDDVSFIDNILTSEVGFQSALLTYSWLEPPKGLLGLTSHPNGFLVAFRGRDLLFSVPYRPHAWPEEYVLTVEHPIVNIGVFDNSIVILTEGHPYIATGIVPEAMSLSKYETPVPCLSFHGVVAVPGAVLFPSREGLYVAGPSGFQNFTEALMTESEWKQHNPDWMLAARDGDSYVAFYDTDSGLQDIDTGFTIDPSDAMSAFSHLRGEAVTPGGAILSNVDGIQTDYHTGEAYILSDNVVYWYDPVHTAPMEFEWWSKTAVLPNPVNFGAMEIGWREEAHTVHDAPLYTGDKLVFRLFPDILKPDEQPAIDRSIEIDLGAIKAEQSPLVVPQRTIRLPAGFKSDVWWFMLKGTAVVEYVKIGETGADLKEV